MKKIISILTAFILLAALLCSCTAKPKVEVNGTRISPDIYSYYADSIQKDNPDMTPEEQEEKIAKAISKYVMVNSEVTNRGILLSTADKSDISQKVNDYWHLFSAYYTSIGVSKQTIYNIEENKKFEEALLLTYYGESGEKPIAEEELKTYFKENYIAFKSITGFLTTVNDNGEAITLSKEEKDNLLSHFADYANAINDGATLEDVSVAVENVNTSTDSVVIGRENTSYPAGFFDNVFAIEEGKAGSFSIGDYVFVVQRESLENDEHNFYETYRTHCLKALRGAEFEDVLAQWAKAYTVTIR